MTGSSGGCRLKLPAARTAQSSEGVRTMQHSSCRVRGSTSARLQTAQNVVAVPCGWCRAVQPRV